MYRSLMLPPGLGSAASVALRWSTRSLRHTGLTSTVRDNASQLDRCLPGALHVLQLRVCLLLFEHAKYT